MKKLLLLNSCVFLYLILFIFSASSVSAQGLTCPQQTDPNEPLVKDLLYHQDFNLDCLLPNGDFFNAGQGGTNETLPKCENFANNQQTDDMYRYHMLLGGIPRTYTPQVKWSRNGDEPVPLSCSIPLTCQTACIPVRDIGPVPCSATCTFSPFPNSCPGYGTGSYNVTISNGTRQGTISWDDKSPDSIVSDGAPVAHNYLNAGTYDVLLTCDNGAEACKRRLNVTCQMSVGGPGPTITPLPTVTPNLTPPCPTPQVCMDPCYCDQADQAYVDACLGTTVIGEKNSSRLIAQSNKSSVLGAYIAQAVGGGGSGADQGGCGVGLYCCTPAQIPGTDPWYKLKDMMFYSPNAVSNPIPDPVSEFDPDDNGLCDLGDPTSIRCLNIGNPGGVSAKGNIWLNDAPVSHREWKQEDALYNFKHEYTPQSYLAYVLAKKNYNRITDPENWKTVIDSTKINIVSFDVEIKDNAIKNKAPFVLIVEGNLTIDKNKFSDSTDAMVFIVTEELKITSSMTEVNGVYIANSIDFASDILPGETTDNELKMTGNVISYTPSLCTEKRKRTSDTDKPTCFFVFNPTSYFGTFNILSSISYDWQQDVQ